MTVDNLKDKLNGIPAHYNVVTHIKVKGKDKYIVVPYESSAQFLNYFMVHGRTTHKAWIESWQYRTLKLTIGSGAIYEAIPVDANIPLREEDKMNEI